MSSLQLDLCRRFSNVFSKILTCLSFSIFSRRLTSSYRDPVNLTCEGSRIAPLLGLFLMLYIHSTLIDVEKKNSCFVPKLYIAYKFNKHFYSNISDELSCCNWNGISCKSVWIVVFHGFSKFWLFGLFVFFKRTTNWNVHSAQNMKTFLGVRGQHSSTIIRTVYEYNVHNICMQINEHRLPRNGIHYETWNGIELVCVEWISQFSCHYIRTTDFHCVAYGV